MAKIRDFHALAPLQGIASLNQRSLLAPVPESAWLLITDVKGSTRAVEQGKYRDVNLVGASTIMAVKNILSYPQLPFIFGGDGATFLVDNEDLPRVLQALRSVRSLAVESFGLELRVGFVSVKELKSSGAELFWGRQMVSPHLSMAVFHGNGFDLGEKWIKSDDRHCVSDYADPQLAPVDGLECRWQPLSAQKGSFISVIIRLLGDESDLFAKVERILKTQVPRVEESQLKISKNPLSFFGEARVLRRGAGWMGLVGLWLGVWARAIYGIFAFSSLGPESWSRYREELVQNTDTLKYDNQLRFVVDLQPEIQLQLRILLDEQQARGLIVYGWHESPTAMMTCLVSSRDGDHLHLLDGGDGGYTRAAQQLKQELKLRSEATRSLS